MHHLGLPDWKAKNRVAEALGFAVNQRWEVLPQANEALAAATRLNRGWLRKHLPDIIVVTFLLFLCIGVYRGCSSRTALVAPHGLVPFQLITPSDIGVIGHGKDLTIAGKEIVGKYSTVSVLPGGEISFSSLSFRSLPANALEGRRILRLTLQASPLAEAFRSLLPVKISLMIAPKDKDLKGTLLDNIYILDVQTQADNISAVAAVTDADAQLLASFEAKSDLIIVGPIR